MKDINVSIIIPVYNAERYIKKCLDSILNQTYKEFEVICVNDGSKDNSLCLLEEYKKKDNRIIVINQINGGPSKARNIGIYKARGKYISFIDADDFIDSMFLEEMLNGLIDSDMIICNYVEINNTGQHKVNIFKFLEDKEVENNIEIIDEVVSGQGGLVWGKLFKIGIINKNNLRFDEKYKMCEDLLFVMQYLTHTKIIKKINKNLYIHNKCNENSITANYSGDMFFNQLEIHEHIRDIIRKMEFNTEDISSVLNERLKNILMYSIYKETKNRNSFKSKTKIIKQFISCDVINIEKLQFKSNGPIDKLLVQAIVNNNVIGIYILTRIREILLFIYNRFTSLRGK